MGASNDTEKAIATAKYSATVSGRWQVGVAAWIVSETATTATVRIAGIIKNVYSANLVFSAAGFDIRVDEYGGPILTKEAYSEIASTHFTVSRNSAFVFGIKDEVYEKVSTEKSAPLFVMAYSDFGNIYGDINFETSIAIPPLSLVPYAPSGISVIRKSESSKQISWTNKTDATHPYKQLHIERKAGSGPWSLIATISGASTSYIDQSTPTNNYFQYRVRASNLAGYGAYVSSDIVYNSPHVPVIGHAERITSATIELTIINVAYQATSLLVQRAERGAHDWEDISAADGKISVFRDNPPVGVYRYRARNVLDCGSETLYSDWSNPSDYIAASCPPDPPSLISPASGAVAESSSVSLAWQHNAPDMSIQQAAEIEFSLDSGENWDTISIEDSQSSYDITNLVPLNSTVTWRVRTKGDYSEWSQWSNTLMFYVRKKPSATFSPSSQDTIGNIPVYVVMDYSDESGELANITVDIRMGPSENDQLICSYNAGTSTSFEIPLSVFVPTNKTTYTFVYKVRSTSGLSLTKTESINVEFVEPRLGDLIIEREEETGYSFITIEEVYDEDREPAIDFSVWRVVDGERTLLAEHNQANSSFVDMYAPLNTEFSYEVLSRAASDVFAINTVNAYFNSQRAFFYWSGKCAYLDYNPEGSIDISRPSKVRQYYAGRKYAVSYDSTNIDETESFSGRSFDRENVRKLRELMRDGGRCIYKSLDGQVYVADIDLNMVPFYSTPGVYGDITVTLTRIDGGEL